MAAQTHAGDAQQDVPQRYLNAPAPPTLPGMKQKRQVLCRSLLKGHCHYGEDCTFAHDWSTLKENSQENPNGGPSRCARTGRFSRWESKGGRYGKIPNAEYCAMTAAWALKDWCNNRHIPEWVMPGMVIAFHRHGLWFLWHLAILMKDQVGDNCPQLPLPCEEGAQPTPLPSRPRSSDRARLKSKSRSRATNKEKLVGHIRMAGRRLLTQGHAHLQEFARHLSMPSQGPRIAGYRGILEGNSRVNLDRLHTPSRQL